MVTCIKVSELLEDALSIQTSLAVLHFFRRRLLAVGPVYRRVTPYTRKRTHFTSRKRAGRNPGEVVRQSNIWKRVYDVDPSWFTLEGYTTVCSLRPTSTRHLNMPYERRRISEHGGGDSHERSI